MIQDVNELSASLRYASAWADKLEALRLHSVETGEAMLSTTAAGPLAEVRRVLAEARKFVEDLNAEVQPEVPDYRLPAPERQKVA